MIYTDSQLASAWARRLIRETAMTTTFEQRQAMKADTAIVAKQLRAAGFEVFSSGYDAITMRVKQGDAGYTVVPVSEAKKLLNA